jgi:hypothetical protein
VAGGGLSGRSLAAIDFPAVTDGEKVNDVVGQVDGVNYPVIADPETRVWKIWRAFTGPQG